MVRDKDEVNVLREVYMSLLDRKPIPTDVSVAFIEKYLRGRNGEIRSWDEVFGRPTRYGTGEKIKRQMEQERLVVDEVNRVKAEGKPLNEEEFEAIGSRTAVGGKSKVKELLSEGRSWAERMNQLSQLSRLFRRD